MKTAQQVVNLRLVNNDKTQGEAPQHDSKTRISPRFIQTTYYGNSGEKVLWVNLASDAERAILHAVRHMRQNDYNAFVAEVSDISTGELHGVVTLSVTGEVAIVWQRPYKGAATVIKIG